MLFCFELSVASLVRSGYFASLYFWIDLAATLSMLLDITSLMDLIFAQTTMAGTSALARMDQNKVSVRCSAFYRAACFCCQKMGCQEQIYGALDGKSLMWSFARHAGYPWNVAVLSGLPQQNAVLYE